MVEFNLLDAELLSVREEKHLLREEVIHLKEEVIHLKEETKHLKERLEDRQEKVQSTTNTPVKELEEHQKELLQQAENERLILGNDYISRSVRYQGLK